MARTDYIGLRIARWRDIAGMTQQQLADAVGVTKAYISQIENGRRPVEKRSLLGAFATALGVGVGDLTGQPEQPRNGDDMAIYSAVPGIRGALDDDPDDPADPGEVARRVDEAMRARMACDYPTLAKLLPGVLTGTRQLANAGNEQGLPLFVRSAICAALAIKPFGHLDLAARLAERAERAASLLGQPVEQAAAQFMLSQTALSAATAGARRRSLTVASEAAQRLGDDGDDNALTWYGLLHLQAALAAASLARDADVTMHLGEADAAAARVQSDPWRMEFTPANCGVWRVGASVENGEPEKAPEYARRIDRSTLKTANRLVRLHIDTGRGHYAAGDLAAAVRQFLAADEVSPMELRTRPSVRELVGQMVRDARRRGSAELQDLAIRCGVDPLSPDPS
ncbi:helix-turn-helix domain-containing protein [Micromonospora zhanjiangensis]|uniref:Helix-turn-helix domain-containing protein n=1 Tax=Micromonospora zhanjiangensis TaxID=1522057 RepID=A0ABV8KKD2_9ACTN